MVSIACLQKRKRSSAHHNGTATLSMGAHMWYWALEDSLSFNWFIRMLCRRHCLEKKLMAYDYALRDTHIFSTFQPLRDARVYHCFSSLSRLLTAPIIFGPPCLNIWPMRLSFFRTRLRRTIWFHRPILIAQQVFFKIMIITPLSKLQRQNLIVRTLQQLG